MREKVLILVLFSLVVSAVVGLSMLHVAADRPAGAPTKPSEAGEFRGIALQIHNGSADVPFESYIDEIAGTGANSLFLVVSGRQENTSSATIFIDLRKTPPDARIKGLITHARRRGLRVVFMPIVLLEDPRAGEWRGKIKPEKGDWDTWWRYYTSFVLHYAQIAQDGGAEVFMVGSELISTEKMEQRWRDLIAKTRRVFRGRLGYSANWDHYTPIRWWDALDIVGMTAYYDLTGGKEPTVERLVEAWKPIRKDILAWQAKINRRLLFTEVGWPNQDTCAQYPWDYTRSSKPDPTAQANCFEAFFRTWIQEPAVAGILVWKWRDHPGQKTGPEDTSYVPMGKPAMGVIRKYLRHPGPKPAPAPTSQPKTTQPRVSRRGVTPASGCLLARNPPLPADA